LSSHVPTVRNCAPTATIAAKISSISPPIEKFGLRL
jgi:hypothetical protein